MKESFDKLLLIYHKVFTAMLAWASQSSVCMNIPEFRFKTLLSPNSNCSHLGVFSIYSFQLVLYWSQRLLFLHLNILKLFLLRYYLVILSNARTISFDVFSLFDSWFCLCYFIYFFITYFLGHLMFVHTILIILRWNKSIDFSLVSVNVDNLDLYKKRKIAKSRTFLSVINFPRGPCCQVIFITISQWFWFVPSRLIEIR